MAKTVRVSYTGDASSLERATGRAERALAGIGRRGPRALSSVAKAAGIATVAVGGLAVVVGKKSLDAYIESEKVQRRFLTQLRATGVEASRSRKHIESWIDSRSKMSGFDDEDLTESFTGLLRATKDVDQATELLTLSMDIARGKGIDLAAANQLVIKANMGNIGALRRLGIDVKAVTKAQDELRASGEKYTKAQLDAAKAKDKDATALKALRLLSKQFKGQTDQFASSTAGSLAKAQVAWENLQETLGEKIAPTAKRVLDLFSKIATAPDLKTAIEIGLKAGKGLVSKLADQLSSAWRSIDWSSVWSRAFSGASRIGEFLVEQGKKLVSGISQGDWDAVGGIAAGAILGALALKKVGGKLGIPNPLGLVTGGRGVLGGALKTMTVSAATVIVNGGVSGAIDGAGGKGKKGRRGLIPIIGGAAGVVTGVAAAAADDTLFGTGLPQGPSLADLWRRVVNFGSTKAPVSLSVPTSHNLRVSGAAAGPFLALATSAGKYEQAVKSATTTSEGSFSKIRRAVDLVATSIANMKPKTVDVKAKTNPRDVDTMRSKIDGVKGKTVPVRADVDFTQLRAFATMLANLPTVKRIQLQTFSSGPGRAGGGAIPGRYSDGDVHPAMLSGEEVVLNPRQQAMVGPGRIFSALKATGAPTRGFRFAKGKMPARERHRRREAAAEAAAAAARGRAGAEAVTGRLVRVPDQPPVGLRLAVSRARNKRDLQAEINAWNAIRSWWMSWRGKNISKEDRIRVLDEITAAEDTIAQLGDQFTAGFGPGPGLPQAGEQAPPSPDTLAQLEQANRRLEASKRAGQLQSAFLGALGIGTDATGGVTINLNGLTYPPSPDVIASLGRTVAQAVSGQAFQPSTAESLGV